MNKLRQGLCLAVCAMTVRMATAADAPRDSVPPTVVTRPGSWLPPGPARQSAPGCQPAGFIKAGAKSPPDLSGPLPVADYLDSLFDCTDLGVLGDPALFKPRNEWIENDAKQYGDILARGRFPWLVVPVQTQYYGFDRIERALMSAEIAEAFAEQGSAPDPLLTARALGEVRRRYEPGAAMLLASRIQATRLLETYAGHDGNGKMTLTLILRECRPNTGCSNSKQHDWRGLPFSSTQPPFLVVRAMRDALVREMIGGKAAAIRPATPGVKTADLSNLGRSPTGAESSVLSTTIAALAPYADEIGHDRLSVLALRDALNAAPSPANRVRAAYAAYRLERRPYALKLLEGMKVPAAVTLRELLNGNLPEAAAGLNRVDIPDLKLALGFALQDMRVRYEKPVEFDRSAAMNLFGAGGEDSPWPLVVERRANDFFPWSLTDGTVPKLLLDRVVPIAGQDLRSVVKGLGVIGRGDVLGDPLALPAVRHARQAQSKLAAASCCSVGQDNARWPVYWLAESIAMSNLIKSATYQLHIQGNPDVAMKLLDISKAYFAGQPKFEVLRFEAATELTKRAGDDEIKTLDKVANAAELSAAFWSQGQGLAAYDSVLRRSDTQLVRAAYTADFPPRHFWPPVNPRAACEALDYSALNPEPAFFCISATPPDKQSALRANIAGRFHGNAQAAAMLRQITPHPVNTDPAAELRAAIAQDPESWDAYAALGRLLIRRDGNYKEAQKVFLSYPGFRPGNSTQAVRDSNAAFVAGSQLLTGGQGDLARPLFQVAANLNTGSAGSMGAEEWLEILDGHYEAAAGAALRRGQRYPNSPAYRYYLSLLQVLGHGDEAQAGFQQVATRFDDSDVWLAQLVIHRMQAQSPARFDAWIRSAEVRDAHYRGLRYAPIYAFWWMTTDRTPTANFVQTMQEIEKGAKRPVEYDGIGIGRPSYTEQEGFRLTHPSPFAMAKAQAARLPANSNAPSEYVLLADALSSHYASDYAAAVRKFTTLASRYPIEEDETAVALSYFAYAAAKTGDKIGLEAYIANIPQPEENFDVLLSRAYFAAVRRDANSAVAALMRALNVLPGIEQRLVLSEYQWVEACEIVLRETADKRIAPMIVDWARRFQRVNPVSSWAYAVEAQYSTNVADVNRALALTLYLDPQSPRLSKFDAAKIAAARAWLKADNPFLNKMAKRNSRPGI